MVDQLQLVQSCEAGESVQLSGQNLTVESWSQLILNFDGNEPMIWAGLGVPVQQMGPDFALQDSVV